MTVKKIIFLLSVILTLSLYTSCQNRQEVLFSSEDSVNDSTGFHADVKMLAIPGGEYKPFYGSDTIQVKVAPFLIDERPVTNIEFLEFVKRFPDWQRSNVKRLYADTNYLKDWESDVELPSGAEPDAPVCYVSWYAAKAFAKAVGKRLPTLDEWEFVAMADDSVPNARNKKSYSGKIVNLYLVKNRQFNKTKQSAPNYWGVYNMFDLVWEWTDDFNSVLITGDSRSGNYSDKNLFCAGGATSATDVLNYAAFMRFSLRAGLKANYTVANLGFRCAKNLEVNSASN